MLKAPKLKQVSGKGVYLFAAYLFLMFTACDLLGSEKGRILAAAQENQKNQAPEPDAIMSPGEKMNFHRWLVTEMMEQVYAKPFAKDNKEIGGWANVFSQRGSVEGVYHGLILSSDYTALEKGKADARALRFFALEMAMLNNPILNEQDPKIKAASAEFAKEDLGTSIFTLKRVLGEKVLAEAEARKNDKEKLAAWYSAMAARWAKLKVPFGLPQRDKTDEVFHFNWAKENNLGMIEWELLNKAHRLMNHYGNLNAAAAPPSPAGK